MKTTNKILAIILVIIMVMSIIPITASAATEGKAGDSIYWVIKNGVLMFSGSGEMYSYTSSNAPWRSYKNSITEVILNERITTIGDYAFYNLNITNVEIPEGIRKIGSCAFANCTSLSEVVIRKGVEIIDSNAFANCTSLTNVYYYSPQNDWGLINIRTGNDYLLNAELVCNGVGKVTWEYEEETGTMTFSGNGVIPDYYIDSEDRFLKQPWNDIEKDIKHLVFNEGITSIGTYAFAHCTSLETITMSSVETIGHHAFYDCPVLKKLTTSNSLKVIGRQAFMDCTKFTYIYYSGTQEEWNNVSIGDHWNDEMDYVKVYPIDYKVYSDNGTFQGLTGGGIFSWTFDAHSSTLTISSEGTMGLTLSVPWDKYQYDITKIVFSDSVTGIGSIIFSVYPNIIDVVIPASVTEICAYAFGNNYLITDVYYAGTEEQWKNIAIGDNNDAVLNATIHYNYVECEHNFDSSIITDPTCKIRGYTTYICSICSDSYVDNFVDTACNYNSVITPPTCTNQGYTTYTCLVCGNGYVDDYTDATGHGEYIVSSTTSPTCTKKGYVQYMCSNGCGDNYVEVSEPSLGHVYGDVVEIIEPTCIEDGYTQQICIRCEYAYKYNYVDALGHEYDVVSTTTPTCAEQGYTTYECTECGDTYSDYVDALGHEYIVVSTTVPTCTEQGYTTYECSVCGDTYNDDYVDVTGHSYEWETIVEPTCTTTGTKNGICSVCGDETTETVSRLGHNFGDYVIEYEPTCTKEGRKSKPCSRCDQSTGTIFIPATGHNYGEWETVTEATCQKYGTFQCFCINCGAKNLMSAKDDHKYSIERDVVEATCTTPGSKTLECSECGNTKIETTPSTGHDYAEDVTAPTCTEQGYTTYTCECGDSYVRDYVDALGHTEETIPAVAPSCTETGLTEGVKCSVCGETLTEQKELPANGHTEETIPAVASTCTGTGLTEGAKCSVCGETLTEQKDLPANGHTEEIVSAVEPTCTETGLTEGTKCSVCGQTLTEQETVPATGHADNDGDGYCDADNELLDPSVECDHACHKTGLAKFFFNFILFFQRLFGSNKFCECGITHY